MRLLCCLDGTNTGKVSHAAQMFSTAEPLTIALLTVIDVGPRRDMDRTRERFWRPPLRHGPLTDEMQDAERAVSEEILKTALGDLPQAETLLRQGLPELEIVNAAAEWKADVIVICPRAEYGEPPHIWSAISRACCALCSGSCALPGAAVAPAGWRTIPDQTIVKRAQRARGWGLS